MEVYSPEKRRKAYVEQTRNQLNSLRESVIHFDLSEHQPTLGVYEVLLFIQFANEADSGRVKSTKDFVRETAEDQFDGSATELGNTETTYQVQVMFS